MRNPVLSEDNDYSAWDSEALDDDVAADWSPEVLRLEVAAEGSGERLDKWLATRVSQFSRSRLQQWIEAGAVRVNDGPATIRQPVWEGDRIAVTPQRSAAESAFAPEPMALQVLFEDDAIIVLDKPAGLVVHPAPGNWSGTLLNGLLHHAPALADVPRAGIVHRLDKDTSGLMVVAKTLEAQTEMVRQVQERSVRRQYLAVVHGQPPPFGTFDAPIGRSLRDRKKMAAFREPAPHTRQARTRYRVLALPDPPSASALVALVLCRLETGRTHQIRVHMQSGGFPIYGDPLYGGPRQQDRFPRQALHAWRLGFDHPKHRTGVHFESPPPADLQELLQQLDLPAGLALERLDVPGAGDAS